jgi:hypothetical protein
MNGLLRFGLGLANVSQKTADDLDKSLPGMARLCALAKQLEPIIQRNYPHLKAIEPDLPEVERIIKQAWPDIVSVTPTIEELIDAAKD